LTAPLLISVLLAPPALTVGPPTLLDAGYAQMYNLQFEEAHRDFQEWQRRNPDDPMGPVSDAAAYLFTEFQRLRILESEFFTDDDTFRRPRRLSPDPEAKRDFERALAKGRQLAERRLAISPQDQTALLAAILVTGLQSDYLGLVEKRYVAAFRDMKAGRVLANRLLAINPACYDAYLAIGVENYLLSQKAAPIRWLLRLGGAQTDKQVGLAKLRLTAEHGRYLRPFARLLLATAALRDGDRSRARAMLEGLAEQFPRNDLYRRELARLR
jgi:hypothetical protein